MTQRTTRLGKVSLTPKGEYSEGTSYDRLDVISHEGSSYLALKGFSGIPPTGEGEYTMLLSRKGDKGDKGEGFVVRALFPSIEALQEAVPEPEQGEAYFVGEEQPYDVYVWDTLNGVWINMGPLRGEKGDKGDTGDSAYQEAVRQGFEGSKEEWIASLKGAKGDTGDSAYQEAVKQGFEGSEEEWLASLKGDAGDGLLILAHFDSVEELAAGVTDPRPGDAYSVGTELPYDVYIWDGLKAEWKNNGELQGAKGDTGDSAYQEAVGQGFEGSEEEWLASLKGETGDSAYDEAVKQGFDGTKEEWIASLKGAKGDTGDSAYQEAVKQGFEGSKEEWLASLKGDRGEPGNGGYLINVTKEIPLETGFYTLETAIRAVAGTGLKYAGLVLTFAASEGEWEAYQYTGTTLSGFEDKTNWTPFDSGSGGTGSGFYNVTELHPKEGYHTKETAVAALMDADIEDGKKSGMIITFEKSAGKWEEYRFTGSADQFTNPEYWTLYGGIRKVRLVRGASHEEIFPDGAGGVDIPIPEVEETVTEGSTNPVSSGAVAAEIKGLNYAADIVLNTIGEGDDVAYSLSLLDKNGEVITTTEQFTGGGGGSVSATKVVLTRITDNPTVKTGDEVKLQFTYDQVDTASGSTTGNPGQAAITISRGATSYTLNQTLAAGSTTTLDVTNYLGTGTNTVRVRVTVGEGAEQQVSQIAWSVTCVDLKLTSSFNIASVIGRGDMVGIPFGLSGSGMKTLRMYVDGVDVEDRTINTSSANGTLSVNTSGLPHGSHSVQLVAELEHGGKSIKSNSIYFDIAVREPGNDTPIFASRFDFGDGTVIESGSRPYVPVKQYDSYTLVYAVYNPRETPTKVDVYEGDKLVSSANVPFQRTELSLRTTTASGIKGRLACGTSAYEYEVKVSASELNISEPLDNLQLKLSATGRSNSDTNREEWSYNGIETQLSGFKFGGDGWLNGALRLTDNARATVRFCPLSAPEQNATNAFAFMIRFKVSDVMEEGVEIVRCMDGKGTGFVITTQEARMVSRGNSTVATQFAAGETYTIGFVAFPPKNSQSSEDGILNDSMLYLYVDGIMSGSVQRGTSDSIYQEDPQYIEIGNNGCTLDVYSMRAYSAELTDAQMLDCFMLDLPGSDELLEKYNANNILDDNGMISVDSMPSDLPYLIVTGKQANGVATLVQAAVTNNKKTKFDIDESLYIDRSSPEKNFRCVGGCISLQGTSSLAYPRKNYRLYFKNSNKVAGELYLGCNEQGVGGTLQESVKYSMRDNSAPVDCFCFKADFAESSSSHNTGMARLVQNVLTAADELTPAQRYVDKEKYPYEVRTTVDGKPCLIFYRETVNDTPVFAGKFNFNNDKSTEVVFGFLDIPGYHDQDWITEKFEGKNPTECWEFLNNDYPMGMFLDDDFDRVEDGAPAWLKVFEARFPDDDDINAEYEAGTLKPKYLKPLVQWVKSTADDGAKFKSELANYFDVPYLCDYFMFTEIMGCVDQRVKNMMFGFWYKPEAEKVLCYPIFYDCDTILGVRNDGRLKYSWDLDENTTDPELSTGDKTVYAYAGHDSVLWNNLREQFQDELSAAYKRIRAKMTNEYIYQHFDKEQSDKFCERLFNKDALYKYIEPKTKGVEVNQDGQVTIMTYSYLEAMQGSRKAHRHWWITNRMSLFDARYNAGQYSATDLTWKGNSAAGAKIKATPSRDFYFAFLRESAVLSHDKVIAGKEWSYTYNAVANVGTAFHFYGGQFTKKLDLSEWGGFTDLNLPTLPILEDLVMGREGEGYGLTELAIGSKLPMLRRLDIRNYNRLPSLDLSGCSRLEEVEATGCTSLSSISFAEGCPLGKLHLPDGYQTLTLRSLSELTREGITFDNIKSITGLWVENCKGLSGFSLFTEILSVPGNALRYIRITGLELSGTGDDLKKWYDAGLGGIDAQGNTMNNRCKLCGTYRLTHYLEDETYRKYVERFDELNIRQPEYTMIEFDDSVSDDANISNLDNETGYKFNNAYKPSAHISTILNARYHCLGKQTEEGVMTVCRLHDSDTNYYADSENVASATSAKLDSTEGDVWMYEPHYWYKGINDYLNNKKYTCFSSNKDKPERPVCKIVTLEEITGSGDLKRNNKLQVGRPDLAGSYISDANYSVCRVSLSGYKRVRFPSVVGSSLVGSLFVDGEGNIISNVMVDSLGCRFVDGMYLICEIPSGAESLYFSIHNNVEFDMVVLSNSDRIEDMEPDWVEHEACLTGVYEAVTVGIKLSSAITGGSSVGSMTKPDFEYYAESRKLQLIDYEMHKDVANLFYARYGRRDAQGQCAYGPNTHVRKIGLTSKLGMRDTVNPEDKTENNAWYEVVGDDGEIKYQTIGATLCMGYENWYGDKLEWMGKVGLPNTPSSEAYKWHIEMPDGSIRKVKSGTTSGYITGVVHQKYCDLIPSFSQPGSSSTHYCDEATVSSATARVVARSINSAYPGGGVAYSYCGYDSSYSYTNYGSRLAFRGRIVVAQSVDAYKSLESIA